METMTIEEYQALPSEHIRAFSFVDQFYKLQAHGHLHPELRLDKIANEGKRSKGFRRKLKREGWRGGLSDYIVFCPNGKFIAIEMKIPGALKLEGAQLAFQLWCQTHNIPHLVTFSPEEAINFIKLHFIP